MASISTLDFDEFVARKRGEGGTFGGRGSEHDYSYVSDRQTRATFERVKPIELAVASSVRMYKQVLRGQLLGNAVKVSERQFPRIDKLTRTCAETLQITMPQVYIVSSPTLNAATYGTPEESLIFIHSALVENYTDQELLTVIGHECGHIHNSHVVYLTALHYLQQVANSLVGIFARPAMLALLAWSRRAEITCDRAGMLCAKDVTVASRALTKLVLGSRKLYEEFNMEAFLEQYEEGKESVGRYMEAFASHPWLPKRVLAMRAFSESAMYRSAVGLGHGGISVSDVDERVRLLLKGDA
jgi:Zn-dependent protease with chaperone function